ncbi:iron complex transport system permease protein [Agromyces flavus]|uniref:Iron complex transport system permease protein n=1 Tax=Agromyces flavus TaxID=589382 RepID=A0A1H1U4V7_9MICO|nr:iron chelate uptake ABC transporter family permease subunit [Agromyces flavus]MCP2368294.1 iron complex transport system permease protein [Agromyces flavus]GGI47755.1 iron ABC transporter permease [Agromyces flavus]SDS67296.1 iron complex transport system permease protein [Agromyces flavus]
MTAATTVVTATPPRTSVRDRPADRPRARRAVAVLAIAALALVAVVTASLALGVRLVEPTDVWQALVAPDPADPDQAVIMQLRVPRTILGIAAGVALGLAGTLIQGVTRNPIADPGLLGVNAGASLAVVLCISLLGVGSPLGYIWFAFAGAAAAAVVVFAIGGAQPVRLALVGAALTALLTPLIALVLLRDTEAFNQYRFWAVGSLTGRDLSTVAALWPFLVVGIALAAGLAHRLNLLALGDDVATALGQRVGVTRAVSGVAIVLLCGTAVALAGPIALVGLVVPHLARRLVGSDYRWMTAAAVVLGPIMLLAADVIGRLVVPNAELEAGVVAAFLGAPVLIAIARSRRVAGL